jgi:hypothetical protein
MRPSPDASYGLASRDASMMADLARFDGGEAMFVENSVDSSPFSASGSTDHFYEEGLAKMNLLTFEESESTALSVA